MELRQLEYFMTLCRELHFTRAAEKLNISQPTLSHQIKVLENEVGVPLFDRLGKKIAITNAGEILLEQCGHIFRALENTKDQINDLKSLNAGNLVMGTLPGELTNLVSEQLLSYHCKYPDIQVSISSSDDLLSLLKDNKVDFAITYTKEHFDYEEEQLVKIPLFTEELLVVAHTNHPILSTETAQFKDVLQYPLILFPTMQQCRKVIDGAARNENLHVTPKLETASTNAIFTFVEQNVGATIISKSLYNLHKTETICARSICNPPLTREVILLYRKDKFINFCAKAFIQLFVDELANMGMYVPEKSLQDMRSLLT
ncbi:LysR family transcriptional regulator [Lysinibacillus sp. NPDC097287]|uniref:LysR family transcriptional regulator n=1 Tax=Lysinibacillus sp. NPDC097287 TaxID=3364144 RepID=UPI003803A47E